ncbi:MAG TPA: GDSL-type esterase/lipase family protein [Methylomirabilota bacterium]
MKRVVGRGLAVLAGCVMALAAIELALTLTFPHMRLLTRHARLGSIPRANLNGRMTFGGHERIVHITTNSLGLRGPELAPKPAGVRRVLALGDSFTFGHAVEAAETWPAVLEQLLNARGGPRWEVVNAGVGGYGTGQELLLYDELESRVTPDLVVLGFAVVNDVLDNLCVYAERWDAKADTPCFRLEGTQLVLTPPRPSPVTRFSWPRSRALEMLMGQARRVTLWNPRVLGIAHSLGIRPSSTTTLPDTVAGWYDERFTEPGWTLTKRLLLELRGHTARHHVPMAVLLIPSALQVDRGLQGALAALADDRASVQAFLRDPHRPQRILGDFCHGAELPCADPLALSLAAETRGERYYYPIDGHWTPAAHRIAAQLVLEQLERAHVLRAS